ncbi:LysM peptidoglycan-binding domain-containing protein [uncultured Nitrospira sp.]|uniref:LysM peptidoglycan-binding domain-containing protein n=1 Tax=uncultured Nitrospira sp. TaxID=157176 RepID=UPI003140C123
MKRNHWTHMILSGTFILAVGGCAQKPTKPVAVDSLIGYASQATPQQVLLQEARTENENLRAEIGAIKVLMAKQAGELQSLRGHTQSIQHREQDQGLELQHLRGELLNSQAERDELRKHNLELEGQVASMPDTTQLVSDIQLLNQSFQQIMASMKQLSTDITLIKQEIHRPYGKGQPLKTKLPVPNPPTSSGDRRIPDSQGRIVIQNGDSLWKLSQMYQVSVAQLREWNELNSDVIMTGLKIQVTSPLVPQVNSSNSSSNTTELPASPAIQEPLTEPVHENMPLQDNRVESAPEPKHILSLGNPQSPESP